jgi:hypothetical protein
LSIEIVAGGPAVGRDRHRIDGADLGRLWIDRIEQRQNILLERIGDVGAGETCGLDGIEQLRQLPTRKEVGVHQMIEAVDAGGCESVGEQSRRQ